ncbi:bifunctional folylpolyglutamate synthase/dihydrofolate synthase [Thermomicrobium sp. 4228-Ro]|uniref:bifunctional folylpolyglutamate synthase/dihydrofolate synthase n=1 Tax=Thermomicrobium sp. 4228-Ro TaxID=2993937 RepID=UPI002248E56F|nr:folylpolyglutamate synthase/dihydrofolate synthase family protein [Thermomicrobium sp. 4228-Ro]MCX2728258.1 bifunctional folylpolyglutamate synthase/dihydrofolate synthase [Thermomicrobium sp. 4228-Ro]
MDYLAALRFLRDRAGYDRGFVANPFADEGIGLARTAWLCAALGDPQQQYRSVHIAGTKGKGSTAAFLTAMLRAAGYRVGLYTSPHLHTLRERVQIDGQPIAPETFGELMAELAEVDALLQRTHPEWGAATAFELVTVLAFVAFARAGVDVGVIEVGLGGRLDATNVILPDVAAITRIGYDHMAILGSTLAAIAREKAGIIKPGRPVVSAPQEPEAAVVIEAVAREHGAPLWLGGRDWQVEGNWERFAFRAPGSELAGLRTSLRGNHQVENAGVALATLPWLAERGVPVPESAIRQGLATAHWPGRLEVLRERPLVVADGAHNRESAERLAEAIPACFRWVRLWLVLGVMRDKEIERIVAALAPFADGLFVVERFAPRAAPVERLRAAWEAIAPGKPVWAFQSVAAALEAALAQAGPDDLVLVTGSLAMAAGAREAFGLAVSDPREHEILLG